MVKVVASVRWSTADIAPGRRFETWREICWSGFYPMAVETDRETQGDYDAAFQSHRFGPYDIVDVRARKYRVTRRSQDGGAGGLDTYHLIRLGAGHVQADFGGRPAELVPGSIALFDPNVPFNSIYHTDWHQRGVRIPRAMLDPLLAPRHRRNGVMLVPPPSGAARLLSATMQGLTAELGEVAPDAAEAMVRTLCHLFSLSVGPAKGTEPEGAEAVHRARLGQVRRLIEARLDDPALGPAEIARRLGISYRQLYLLFEPTGTTFAQHLAARRIARARAALEDPAQSHRTVADIAFASGFADLSTFHRTFRRLAGATPGDLRAR